MSESDDLEREAEAARARLSETADELRARMTPGQLMDEVLGQFRTGDGSQMLSNLKAQARDNPMALALVGSGLAWLMMGSGPSAAGSSANDASVPLGGAGPRPEYGGAGSAFSSYDVGRSAGSFETGASGDYETAGSADYATRTPGGAESGVFGRRDADGSEGDDSGPGLADQAADAMHAARDAVGDRLERAKGQAGRVAESVRSAGSDALGGIRHGAAGAGQQARSAFLDVLEREPLVIGAIGVAVGAAIGAMLPATQLERQHLGSTGEALKEKASELVDRGMGAAKEAASEVYEKAKEEADRQGLVPGDRPIADKIGAVARAAGEAATNVAKKETSGEPGTQNQNQNQTGPA